ncbi:MAG: RNA polymerase sigma factor [Spirochaetales bacterium]|nr:RNA polymerase sigma factor [Spirochaetales bacterium]
MENTVKSNEMKSERPPYLAETDYNTFFTQIYKEFRRPLDFYLQSYCPNKETRKELIQEVFIKLYKNLQNLNMERPIKPYLYRIAGNTGIDWYRSREKRDGTTETEFFETWSEKYPDPALTLIKNEENFLLKRIVSTLKPADRRIVHLHYYENLKIKEISNILLIPSGTVKYRLHRIRKKIATMLKEEENLL